MIDNYRDFDKFCQKLNCLLKINCAYTFIIFSTAIITIYWESCINFQLF